jgi:hypothetical protein
MSGDHHQVKHRAPVVMCFVGAQKSVKRLDAVPAECFKLIRAVQLNI